MSNDDNHQNCPVARREGNQNEQLQQVRQRVATLCQRIKADKDPEAIREVQEQLGRVGRIMRRRPGSWKRRRGGRRG